MGNLQIQPSQHQNIINKIAGFTQREVDKLFERFELMCDNEYEKTVTLDTFQKLLPLGKKDTEELFDAFDTDKSGSVSSFEFISGVSLFSQSPLDKKAETVFYLFDEDRSQVLDRSEILRLMKAVIHTLSALADQRPPENEDIEREIDKLISKYDENKDKSFSLFEFQSVVSKDKQILRVLLDHGVITQEELRKDFGGYTGDGDIPDCDSDLEEELNHDDDEMDDAQEARKLGIEHKQIDPDDMFEVEEASGGDQFMAVKPWVGTVKATVPSSYKKSKFDADAPESQLKLHYVHGYRCHDTRNNLAYNSKGEVVYHTAAIGIALNKKSNTQNYYINHTDDITAFDILGDKVVTGQMGKKPLISVWDCVTMKTIASFQGPLQNSISHVAFSPDGQRIAAIANDPDHSVGIFDIKKASEQGSTAAKARTDGSIIVGKGPSAEALCLKFHPNKPKLYIACVKEFTVCTWDKNVIKLTRGSWGDVPQQALPSIGFIGDSPVTGSFSGKLLFWKGDGTPTIKDGHAETVNCIWTRAGDNGIISGSNDGKILVWDRTLKITNTIDLKALKISMGPKIRALSEGQGGSIVCGTRGGEIIEFNNNKPTILIKGHFDDELWGLCTHPIADTYYTVGQDMLLAYWDVKSKTQKNSVKLEYKATCLAISNDGNHLAVGCINGAVLICDPETLKINKTIKSRTKQISELKFSPDATFLASGAHDSEILVYNVKSDFKLQGKLKGHHSTITHFDFSEDGEFLQSNCTSYELLFWKVKQGTRVSSASQFRDEKWSTWTCTIGWPVQGIWPACSDGSDINAVDRHPLKNVLATADDFSHVKLLKYPCPVEKSSFVMYTGHSSHVTNVRFTKTGNYLLTTGGADKAIFQWEFDHDDEGEEASLNRSTLENEEEAPVKNDDVPDEGGFVEEVIEGGDEALAVKPFLGQVQHSTPDWVNAIGKGGKGVPDKYKYVASNPAAAPNGDLTLKYCHGFRCFEAKNTVKYVADPNKIAFIGAALGVVMEKKSKAQQFYQMHDDDVISFAMHPSGKYAATGQMAAKGKSKRIDIYVWDIETRTMLARLNNFHLRAVNQLCFSPDGKMLLSFGQDDNNSLALYDWAQGVLVCTSKVDQAKVTGCGFKGDSEFFSCGLGHVKFWSLQGKNCTGKRAAFTDKELQKEAFLCGAWAFDGKLCLVGTQAGRLIGFSGGSSNIIIPDAHPGGVSTIIGTKLFGFTGGKDGLIIGWSYSNSKLVRGVTFSQLCKGGTMYNPQIMSLDASDDGKRILVGIRGGEIYELTNSGEKNLLLQGHYEGELWGLATSPKGNNYVTCGGDKTIRLWDSQTLKMITSTKVLENEMRAVDWSPNGEYIVVADMKGKLRLFDDKLEQLDFKESKFNKKDQWVEEIKFSPDSTKIAFGAHGGCSPIEIFNVVGGKLQYEKTLVIGISSALLHLDWSCDGSMMAVTSQAYELLFINANAGKNDKKQVSASATKDEEYFTWTNKLGWQVKGIFKNVDYTDVNTVHRAANKRILATGDDDGFVNLYKYPCIVPKGECKAYNAHSSHVTRVRFLYNDSKLISTGGNDKCVLVWETNFGTGNDQELDNEHVDGDSDTEAKNDIPKAKDKKKAVDAYDKSKTEKIQKSKTIKKVEVEEEVDFEVQEPEAGDEFMAVKPWIGQMKPPTSFNRPSANQEKAPKVNLELDYVHGYRAKDCRNNIRYLQNGNIVYHAAALGIVLDIASNTQKFFNLHIDDITSMDLHPNGVFVATGEIGPNPQIFVWDSNSMQTIVKIRGGLQKGIANLSFSPSGKYLVGCAVDDNHMVGVYDAELGALIGIEKGDTAPIIALKFKNDSEFVSVGPKHYKYWSVQNKVLKGKRGQFGDGNNSLKCVTFNGETALVGAADGGLQTWSGASYGKSYPRHKGTLDALYVGKFVVSGGADGNIHIMDKKSYDIVNTISLQKLASDAVSPKLRSVAFDESETTLVVGTYGSEIYTLSTSDKGITKSSQFKAANLIRGHYTPNQQWTNEIWGLLVYNESNNWGTCSDDGTFRVWSADEKKQIMMANLNVDESGKPLPADEKTKDLVDAAKGRCCEISPSDDTIVIGCKDGTIRVLEADTLKYRKVFKHAKEWVSELKFSPDGKKLAAGSHDNGIYLYDVENDFEKLFVMKKHSSYITHLDWAVDGAALHSNCGAYELLYWDANNGSQLKSGATQFRDEEWKTWTCVLGWPVQGIFPPGANGTDVKYCDRTKGKLQGMGYQLLATSDNFGKLNLYRYPCIQKGAEAIKGAGHSSHVTCCKFDRADVCIYTTGGEDNCVFQWKVRSAL